MIVVGDTGDRRSDGDNGSCSKSSSMAGMGGVVVQVWKVE